MFLVQSYVNLVNKSQEWENRDRHLGRLISFVTELVSYLEPWESRDAVLARVSLAPFLPWLPIDAWEALGSW